MNRDRLPLLATLVVLLVGLAAMFLYMQQDDMQEDLDTGDNPFVHQRKENETVHISREKGAEEPVPQTSGKSGEEPARIQLPDPSDGCAHVLGRVINRQKQPVAGAVVALCLDISDFRSRTRLSRIVDHTTTDEDGRFVLRDVHVGEIYSLRAESEGYASKWVTGLELRGGESKRYELVMHEGITLKGIVTDLSDQPIAGAKVEVVDVVMQVSDQLGGVERQTVTDEQGRFTVANLNQGFKILRASKPSYASRELVNFHVNPGRAREDLVLKMGPGEALSGRVVDDDGKGVPDVEITAQIFSNTSQRMERQFSTTRSDQNGQFEFPGLKRGSYYLTCRKVGYYSANLRDLAETAAPPVTIFLKQNPVIHGRVLDAETRQPVKHFTLFSTPRESLLFVSQNARQTFDSEDGSFAFRCFRNKGDVYLHVESPEYAFGLSKRIVLSRQKEVRGIVIEAHRGAVATGRVVDAEGKPLKGAKVEMEIVPEGSQGLGGLGAMVYGKLALLQRKVLTGDDGHFRITRLRPGTYRVHVKHGTHAERRGARLHEISRGGEFSLGDLVLRKGGTLKGVAFDRDDSTMAGVLVKLVPEDSAYTGGFDIETKTDSQGRFTFKHLEAGAYQLQIIRSARLAQLAGQIPNLPTAKYMHVLIAEGEERHIEVRGL